MRKGTRLEAYAVGESNGAIRIPKRDSNGYPLGGVVLRGHDDSGDRTPGIQESGDKRNKWSGKGRERDRSGRVVGVVRTEKRGLVEK